MQRHIVRRQTIELTVPDEITAHRLHADVRQLQSTSLTSVIERCCSIADDLAHVEQIPHLDVDLGRFDPHNFESEFVARLCERLPVALDAYLAETRTQITNRTDNDLAEPDSNRRSRMSADHSMASAPGRHAASGPTRSTPTDSPARSTSDTSSKSSLVVEQDDPRSTSAGRTGIIDNRGLELLLHFMRFGTLPWWADLLQPDVLAETVTHAIDATPMALHSLLRGVITSHAPVSRLVQALDDSVLEALAELVAPDVCAVVAPHELIGVLAESAALPESSSRRRRSMAWQSVLESALGDVERDPTAVVRRSLRVLARVAAVDRNDLVEGALVAARSTDSPRALLNAIEAASRRPAPSSVAAPSVEHVERARRDQVDRAAAQERMVPHHAPIDELFSDSDHVEVRSAGLVLLAPFLNRFADRMGLLDGNAFVDPKARHRAVGLFSYLVTGARIPTEYLTTLEKVLAGMEIAEVLEFGEPVTDEEATQCSDLLRAVIEHADMFGDLSPDGLRGTFLLRRGVLAAEDGHWVLRVERQPYDVILDRLPWSFSWLVLPWMHTPVRVEW